MGVIFPLTLTLDELLEKCEDVRIVTLDELLEKCEDVRIGGNICDKTPARRTKKANIDEPRRAA